eukprot:2746766-Pleurochrysis_carterae.AAC.1
MARGAPRPVLNQSSHTRRPLLASNVTHSAFTELTADAPHSLRHASPPSCAAYAEANSTRLPHPNELYKPSHPGRLIHVDVSGPFLSSVDGGCRYALVIVDDHSRFKAVHMMRHKHEAPKHIRRFLA